jgi:nicotinate-nucleotide adenylyltransferase
VKVGIMGGTFDPIHLGHLRGAENAREALGLDEVRFLPAQVPPHRPVPASSARDRYAMVALATALHPRFVADDLELRREGPSYTVDTIARVRDERPGDDFVLIVGSDTFPELSTWKDHDRLFRMCTVAVVTRPDDGGPDPAAPSVDRAQRVPGPGLAVSATDVRRRVKEGLSIRYLVPDAVADYIAKRGLYR